MTHNHLSLLVLAGLLITSLCACQHTLEGLGADMQTNGKLLAEYSKNLSETKS